MSKVWLITGSSRGLGRAFTVAALEAGHRVVAGARKPELFDQTQSCFFLFLPDNLANVRIIK